MATSSGNVESLNGNVETSNGNVESSGGNVATSNGNVVTSNGNVESSDKNIATSIKKKMSREEMQQLILSNCLEWISLEMLSEKVKRKPTYLRNYIIPVLIASKQLQMLYPGTPNHPHQKYKVSD